MAASSRHSIIGRIDSLLEQDREVSSADLASGWRSLFGFDLIAAIGFALMSVLNVLQHSHLMLCITAGSSAVLLICCVIAYMAGKKNAILRWGIACVCIVIFTAFVLMGGNEGFAALWLVLVPLVSMTVLGLRMGLGVSLYFLVFLVIFFYTPLKDLIAYDYAPMFMLRFPFLYLIALALGTWTACRLVQSRYEVLMQKRELDVSSITDVLTGLLNTGGLAKFTEKFDASGCSCVTVVYSDVNGLHELNNSEGHKAGDAMLVAVADELSSTFEGYTSFRAGGDEFVVICPNADEEKVRELARLFEDRVLARGYYMSTGYATWTRSEHGGSCDINALLSEADKRMLEQKRAFHRAHPEFDRRRESS